MIRKIKFLVLGMLIGCLLQLFISSDVILYVIAIVLTLVSYMKFVFNQESKN